MILLKGIFDFLTAQHNSAESIRKALLTML